MSNFKELMKKSQEINRKYNPDSAHMPKPQTINQLKLHEDLLETKFWVLINGAGPLIPEGDYRIKDDTLHLLDEFGDPLDIPDKWAIVFIMPQLMIMYVHQKGKWEKHS